MKNEQQITIFESPDGHTQVEVKLEDNTLWLTQAQMAELFDKDVRTINEHIINIFKEQELTRSEATIRNFRIVRQEGNRQVERNIDHYNLDAIISVGYRVSSKKGTQFRIWATQRLNEYLVQGYTIDQHRFDQNAKELKQALALIEKTAKSPELNQDAGRGLVEIVSRYTQSFLWLQRYDEGLLEEPQGQAGGILPTAKQTRESLTQLKSSLIKRGEATELFANERNDGIESILGNLEQSVFGEPAYPTIEGKAAHLLYFFVKNHPFTDGNKRSGDFYLLTFCIVITVFWIKIIFPY